MTDERSRKRLWEDFVYGFLQKTPAEVVQAQGKAAIANIATLADAMLAEHEARFKKPDRPTLGLTKTEK